MRRASTTEPSDTPVLTVGAVSTSAHHGHESGPRLASRSRVRVKPERQHETKRARDEDRADDADGGALLAVAVLAAATVVFIAAAIEGPRYDGWARLEPEQPLHYRTPAGAWAWLPLSRLTPTLATQLDGSAVSDDDHILVRLSRAPLDRQGLTCGFALGAGQLHTRDKSAAWGFGAQLEFGGFFSQGFGAVLGLGLNAVDKQSVTGQRVYLELQGYPLAFGRLQLGVYGQAGRAFGAQRADDAAWFGAAGGVVQLEISTRLALTLRGGASVLPNAPGRDLLPEVRVGLAVY